jgi:DHA2 family multidrug resistance protein
MTSPNSPWIIFVAVMASLLEIIDISIVNVALPNMMGNLGATLSDISMVITGYAIANAIVLPVSAWLGERIGRRKYYLSCIALFTATSVACGLAPNLFSLIFFRILQGLVGGALLPTSQTLIYEQFPKEKAGIAGAVFGMSVMIGPTLGPVLGGYLTDEFGWRMIFNVNLPLGLFALYMGYRYIQNPERQGKDNPLLKQKLDAFGLGLLIAGIGCLQYVLERGEADDWFSSRAIVVNTIIFSIALPLFVWWELRIKNPIINLRLFKESPVVNGVLLMMGLGFYLYGLIFVLPIFVGTSFHYTATQTGMLFIPGSILTAMIMPFVGKGMQKGANPKYMIGFGLICLEITIFMVTLFSPQTSEAQILWMLMVRGIGLAFLFVPINSSILSQYSGYEMGQVAGMLNLFRQIGGSIGIALIATLLTMNTQQNTLELISNTTLLNPQAQVTYQQMIGNFGHQMSANVGFISAQQAALKALWGRVQAQAFMMSFLQLAWMIGIIFSLTFIPLYLLKYKTKKIQVVDSH